MDHYSWWNIPVVLRIIRVAIETGGIDFSGLGSKNIKKNIRNKD
jgi:hypothetical protein